MIGLFQSNIDGEGYQYSELIGIYEKESDIPEHLRDPNPTEEEINVFIETIYNTDGYVTSREDAIEHLTPRYYSLDDTSYDNNDSLVCEGYLYIKELSINPKIEKIVRFQPW